MIDVIKQMIDDAKNEMHTILPGKITSIDYGAGTCSVAIIPKRELCQKIIKYPVLIDVKLDFIKFGQWKLQFPRKVGDQVWVGFSEAAIADEVSLERFSLNEPFIIGSCSSGYENNSEDIILTNNATRIEIKGDGGLILTTGNNKMTINSDLTLKGDLTIIGDTSQKGKIEASGDITGNGISLGKHTHSYNPGPNPPSNTSKAQ